MASRGITKELKPSPRMKKLYIIYAIVAVLAGVLSWCIPLTVSLLDNKEALLALFFTVYLPLIILLAIFFYWLPRYYNSIRYIIKNDRLIVRKGVWWKNESSIPIYKINEVEYRQGPLQRALGLATLGFHTAARGTPVPEVVFAHMDVKEANITREHILRMLKPIPKETFEEQVLKELNKIRSLLERMANK